MREQYERILIRYLPEKAIPLITDWIISDRIHLKITKERTTKLGDFLPGQSGRGHRITVNHNLNPYAFLITLVHEIAHLHTWNAHGARVKPHGLEWKASFQHRMEPFLHEEIFPPPILHALITHMEMPFAASCSDEHLLRILRKFDHEPSLLLEELPLGTTFRLKTGRTFVKGLKRRKYYRCEELPGGRQYLINPLTEVEQILQS